MQNPSGTNFFPASTPIPRERAEKIDSPRYQTFCQTPSRSRERGANVNLSTANIQLKGGIWEIPIFQDLSFGSPTAETDLPEYLRDAPVTPNGFYRW